MALHLILLELFPVILLCFPVIAKSMSDPWSHENGTQNVHNYIFPNSSILCRTTVQHPCLTLNDYANNVDTYFVNDSTFVFIPGNHKLSLGVTIRGVHNISIIGLSENNVTIEILNESVFFVCESCMNVIITNIIFEIGGPFKSILSFLATNIVKLSNITILGNSHIGCSSIITERSVVEISDSTFIGIKGYYGAALIALKSTITFTGNNSFTNNEAQSGGALFLYNYSIVLFSGTILFSKNSAVTSYSDITMKCTATNRLYRVSNLSGLGGAIFSSNSSITSIDCFKFRINGTNDTSNILCSSGFFSRCYPINNSNSKHADSQLRQICKCTTNNMSENYCIEENISPCMSSRPNIKKIILSLQFHHNRATLSGGSIFCRNSFIEFIGTIEFIGNSAAESGGALLMTDTSSGVLGSPWLTYIDSSLHFSSHILVLNNSAGFAGGAIVLNNSKLTMDGNICLVKNHAYFFGGALYIINSLNTIAIKVFTRGFIMFIDNFVNGRGGAMYLGNSTLQICGCVSLIKNHAMISGGAISLSSSTLQMCGHVFLIKNYANNSGGAIFIVISLIQLCGNVSLINNSASNGGGAISLSLSTVQMCGSASFVNNIAKVGGAVYTEASYISIGVNCIAARVSRTTTVFHQNTATYSGGAINSLDSHLYFMGSVLFDGNTAGYGGAMILDGTSNLIQHPNLTLHFINNRANEKGGVFYYDQSVTSCDSFEKYYEHIPICFVSLEGISLELKKNSASKAGSFLYSGNLGICYRYSSKISVFEGCKHNLKSRQNFCSELHLHFKNSNNTQNETKKKLSADAEDVNFCSFQSYSCKKMNVSVFPGEKFNVPLTSTGTFNLPVSTRILHKMLLPMDDNIELRRVQRLTKVNNSCTNISYYLLLSENAYQPTAHFKLYHQNPCDSLVDGINLYVDIKPCPLGFQLSRERYKCTCDIWLQNFGVTECNIDNLSVERKKNTFWVSKQDNNSGLIFYNNRCLFDFCKDEKLNVSLDNAIVQCDFNRNGTLCGQCQKQYSLALGTLHCLNCIKNYYNIALIIPFALAGIALVMVILLLHLTVDVGTLNGLVFYANIVHSNREAYFQQTREITHFHAIFISWLNLDFGIETCFYDGMDIYTYSWLQFIFPFYLWFLIGAIIFICRYSQRASKSLGSNPIAALGTVLFLSYGKVLNAIISPLSKTELLLKSNDGSNSTLSVWLYDGSVEYFTDPKHIALGLFAILILLLAFVPYTFILLCGHWLIAYSDKCFLSWLNKLKPVLDVYYAPFKQKSRYWIGLTLLARLALLLTIAINAVGSDNVNILVIASVTAGLLSIKRRVYTHRYNDILESSFVLNLCIFSIVTFYLKENDINNQLSILNASIGITFVTFVGILFFHIYLVLKSTHIWNICVISMFCKSKWLCKVFGIVQKEDEIVALKSNDPQVVTSTLVELREPLIDNDNV